jgi:hypothetical protein
MRSCLGLLIVVIALLLMGVPFFVLVGIGFVLFGLLLIFAD